AELPDEQVAAAVEAWRERLRVHADAAYVHVMVNERAEAGSSLPHTHAQLYALDFVPAAVARERERFGAYATRTMGGNLLGDLVQEEVRRRERIVAIDDEAVLMAPYGGQVPFQLLLAPRQPRARFEDDGASGAAPLHDGLKGAARRLLVTALYTLSPFVTFFNVARLRVDANVVGGLALGIAMLVLVGGAAWLVGARLLRLGRPQQGSLIASVMQANTGYLGLPLVLLLLGSSHLGAGAAYDALVTNPVLFLGVFGAGAAFGARAGEGARERLRAFVLRNPPLVAAVAALLAPASLAPHALVEASRAAVIAWSTTIVVVAGVVAALLT